jgi:hypothetical protein
MLQIISPMNIKMYGFDLCLTNKDNKGHIMNEPVL